MVAYDLDEGENGALQYSLKAGRGVGKFQIDPNDGTIYATSSLKAGESYDMLVKAADRSSKSMSTLARVSLTIEPVSTHAEGHENQAPTLYEKASKVSVLESDPVGHLVTLVAADDKVNDLRF